MKKSLFIIIVVFIHSSLIFPNEIKNEKMINKKVFNNPNSNYKIQKFQFLPDIAEPKDEPKKLSSAQISGIVLVTLGGTFFAGGAGLLFYDLFGYSEIVRNKLYNNAQNSFGYIDFKVSYNIFIGLLTGSIVSILIGTGVLMGGIGNLLYKRKKKKVDVSLSSGSVNVYFSYCF